jgi:histone acetyltransferase 1
VFMGYSTVYRYFYYQTLSPTSSSPAKKQRIQREAISDFQLPVKEIGFSTLPCRSRISQFIILPPFQGGGNGSRFYNAIFDFYFQQPQTIEITLEDPNEAFDDLRDLNDLARLRKLPEFTALRINRAIIPRAKGPVPKEIVDSNTLETIRHKIKIAPRQFARVVEMQLLSLIPSGVRQSMLLERPKATVPDLKARQHEYHLWQLFVKKRLYKHNKDTLIQLDRTERIYKLDDALGGVEADYARLLMHFDRRQNGNGNGASSSGKRGSPDDETMEDEEPAMKKVKFTA